MTRSRWPRRTLRRRFTIWISTILAVAVGISFVLIYQESSHRLKAQVSHDVASDTVALASSLRLLPNPTPAQVLRSARRYVSGQPFSSNSKLLFVLIPGARPVSNYPELFNTEATPEPGEAASAQLAENRLAAALARPQPGAHTRDLPDVGPVLIRQQGLTINRLRIYVGAGEPLNSVIRAQHGVVHSFLLAGAFIAIAILLGVFLVGTRVTAPLRRMADVAAQVDAGDLNPRMTNDRDDEIGVLAIAFNHMLERLDDAFASQRAFVADASHELRTPLTVIQGQLEVLAHRDNPSRDQIQRVERLVQREIQRMRRLVDDLLLLTQAERPDFLQPEPIDVPRFLEQIHDDATLIADRRFTLGAIPPGRLDADPDRLAQALRNLITNAINHTTPTTGEIRIDATHDSNGTITIAVDDNGPGIPPNEVARIFERFHRSAADRTNQLGGTGLGLAIVQAITEAHHGWVTATNTPSGARFELRLPGFQVSTNAPAR